MAEANRHKSNQFIRSFLGASEQNTAGCKQSADRAIKLFATNDIIKKTIRRRRRQEPFYSPRMLEKFNVFVVVDESKLKLYAPLLQLITAQTLDYFSTRPAANTSKILFCLDEFASLGKMDILTALRRLRKRHVRIMICTQSLADIDLEYGENERRAMMNNFAFKVVLGADDADTQEYFSKLVGERMPRAKLQGPEPAQPHPERIILPAEFARLKKGLVLLSPDGHHRLRKNFYYKRF